MSEPSEEILKTFSEKLIKLEKDLTAPGNTTSEAVRIERILTLFNDDESLG